MSLALELKRRLDYDEIPIKKRLKLAENALAYPLLTIANKEDVVIQWLYNQLSDIDDIDANNLFSSLISLIKDVNFKACSTQNKTRFLKILSIHLDKCSEAIKNDNTVKNYNSELLECCSILLNNATIYNSYNEFIFNFFTLIEKSLSNTLLYQKLAIECQPKKDIHKNFIKNIFNSLKSYIKSVNKKTSLVEPFLQSHLLWKLLELIDIDSISSQALNVCQTIVFPNYSLPLYKKYITALISGDDLKILIEKTGENLRPIVVIMDFILKKLDSIEMAQLKRFLNLLIYSFKNDETLLFLLNFIFYKILGVEQEYFDKVNEISPLNFDKESVKNLHLENLRLLSKFNVNLNIKYSPNKTDDEKKVYLTFIQEITVNVIFENFDDLTLLIIKQAFELDPSILEPLVEDLLPNIMVKKNRYISKDLYADTLITVIDIMFKMSRGLDFLTRLLPKVKTTLESLDEEQQKFIKKRTKLIEKGESINEIENNIISCQEMFPVKFCNKFGQLSSDLVSWQHTNTLKVLLNFLNEYSISRLESGDINISVVLVTEIICSLTISFLQYSKIADEDIPETIYMKFDELFKCMGTESLIRFGNVFHKFPEEITLARLFLDLCYNYGHVKLLLYQYQPHYQDDIYDSANEAFHIFNLNLLHGYMSAHQWKKMYKLILKNDDTKSKQLMYNIILQNCIASIINKTNLEHYQSIFEDTKNYILENFNEFLPILLKNNMYSRILYNKFTLSELKIVSKNITVAMINSDEERNEILTLLIDMFKANCIESKKDLLSLIILELLRNIWKMFNKKKITENYFSLYDLSNSDDFSIKNLIKSVPSSEEYFNKMIKCNISDNINEIVNIMTILDKLPTQFLNENLQNSLLFTVILLLSMNEDYKVLHPICKSVLMKLFDMSFKMPNFVDIFSSSFFIQFIENDLFKLSIMSNEQNFNKYDLMKNIFNGIITKDNLTGITEITDVLVNDCKAVDSESTNIFTKESFQVLSLLLIGVSNLKKSNMTSEKKVVTTESYNKLTETLYKSIKRFEPTLESQKVMANILESYSILLIIHSKSKDVKKLKNITKSLESFIKLALEISVDKDSDMFHAKGGTKLINVFMRNYKVLSPSLPQNIQQTLFSQIWIASKSFLENNLKKTEPGWKEVTNIVLENITLTCELSDAKFFNTHLLKELIGSKNYTTEDNSFSCTSAEVSKVIKKLWFCFLNANLKATGKNEARTSIVKQMTKKFYFWLKNVDKSTNLSNFNNYQDINNHIVNDNLVTKKSQEYEITLIYMDVITEFVNTKKMILSNYIIDIIIPMSTIICSQLNHYESISMSTLDVYCVIFEKCTQLLNSLLFHRSEILQDRWPLFFVAFRKLVESLCLKSDSDQPFTSEEIGKLVKLSLNIERITQILVKNAKQDITRLAPYLIADIITSFQKVSVHSLVKFHFQNCINYLMQLLDNHARSFLMRNMTDSSRIMFQKINDDYKKYHKYVGTS